MLVDLFDLLCFLLCCVIALFVRSAFLVLIWFALLYGF